jgi:hypothetical protein
MVHSAAVSCDPEGERELCARAMAALYHAHAAAIGMPGAVGLPLKTSPRVLPVLSATMLPEVGPVHSGCVLFAQSVRAQGS